MVYEITDKGFTPHKHPVFTGEIAYDLPNRAQTLAIDEKTNSRIFNSQSEVLIAMQDYLREDNEIEFGQFVILEVFTVGSGLRKNSKSKNK